MLPHFLVALGFGGSSIRLIEVAQGLKEGKSCIGLTLAETLTSLDAFHRRETNKFARSPLLLQVMFPTLSHMCFSHYSTLRLYFCLKTLPHFFSPHIPFYFLISFFFHPFPDMAHGQVEGSGLLPYIFSTRLFLLPTAS